MKKITLLGSMLLLTLTIACSADSSEEPVTPPVTTCDCYQQTIKINSSNDTIYKGTKIYGQNLGACGVITDLVLPSDNPFVTTHYITNCNLD